MSDQNAILTDAEKEAAALEMLEAETRPDSPVKEPDLVKPSRKAEVSKPTRISISLDNTPQQVLDYEKAGLTLFFEDSLERFLDLPEETVQALSPDNRYKYLLACGVHARLKEHAEHPERFRTPGLEVSPRLASATSRITVTGKNPAMAYCWKRTDELQQAAYEGWKVSADPNLETFGGEVGSSRQVAAGGQTELVLMEMPVEREKALLEAPALKSQKRNENVEKSTLEDIRRSGGLPYSPKPGDKTNFGEI